MSARFAYAKVSDNDAGDVEMEPIVTDDTPSASANASDSSPSSQSTADSTTQPQATVTAADSTAATASAATPHTGIGAGADGVFANVVAAPGKQDVPPKYEDDRLPAYGDVFHGDVPIPFGTVVIAPSQDDLLVDGMQVGSGLTFLFTMLVSWLFGVFGFLCAYLMSSTHAGRSGARAGLGLQLIHWGVYLHSYISQYKWYEDEDGSDSDMIGSSDGSAFFDQYPLPMWLSYVFMLCGWFIFVRACLNLFQARRILHMRLMGLADAS